MTSGLGNIEKDEANWLVKSGDRIMGPFTREELKARLYSREIVVIDEVTTPLKRWRYIRDEPAFAAVVEEIRRSGLSAREDTELGTVSKTIAEISEDTNVPQMVSGGAAQIDVSHIHDVQDIQHAAKPAPEVSAKKFGSANDQRIRAAFSGASRRLWIGSAVALGLALIVFLRVIFGTDSGNDMETGKLEQRARVLRAQGDYEAVIPLYEKLQARQKAAPEILIDLAVMRLKARDESTPPSRILDTVEKQHMTKTEKAKWHTARGLVALYDGAPIERAEKEFDLAVRSDRQFAPAIFNRAIVQFIDNQEELNTSAKSAARLAAEFERVTAITTDVSVTNTARLMSALVSLKSHDADLSQRARESLEQMQQNAVQYYQEAGFLKALARTHTGPAAQVVRDVRAAMSADPFVSDEHFVEPFLYTMPISWQSILPLCEELAKALEATAAKKDVTAELTANFCRFKAGQDPSGARSRVADLEAKSVADPLVRSVSAYMLMGTSPEEAKAKVSDAGSLPSWDLGRIIRGRLCGHEDLECLYDSYRETRSLQTAIYFKVAAARYLSQQDAAKKSLAPEIIEDVEKIAPNYVPLLEFKSEMKR